MNQPPKFHQNRPKNNGVLAVTDRQTNRQTNRPAGRQTWVVGRGGGGGDGGYIYIYIYIYIYTQFRFIQNRSSPTVFIGSG